MLVIILIECSLLQPVVSGINHNEFLAQLKVPQCRQDCLDKVSLHIFDLISSILLFITLLQSKLHKLQKMEKHDHI